MMLKKLVVLVVLGIMLASGTALSQPSALSELQLEGTTGGWWRICGDQWNCLEHDAGCYKSGNPIEAVYVWYIPYPHLRCRFALTSQSCEDNLWLYCGRKKFYDNPYCSPPPVAQDQEEYNWYCGG